jgi:plastocyanin
MSTRAFAFTLALCSLALTVAATRPDGSRPAKLVEVKMTNEGGQVRFVPDNITIQDGDTVRWVIAGGSHNVVFWPDSVPAGAPPLLQKAMPDTAAHLQSPRYPNVGDAYTLVFSGMPKGVYKYFSRPNLMRQMTGAITVE